MIIKLYLGFCALFLGVLWLPVAGQSADSDYQQGMTALASRDVDNGFGHLELAVSRDPESIKFASEYRQAIIRNKQFDRALAFFQKQIAEHPGSANLHLNYGFAYVDKIPAAGSITQVILANSALAEFTKAVEIHPTWLAYYTRGQSYLFWPKIFGRAPAAIDDLQKAMGIQNSGPFHKYYVKVYIALGDAFWKNDQLDKARGVWQEGLQKFPQHEVLQKRLALQGDDLKAAIEANFDPTKRVDTDLKDLWSE